MPVARVITDTEANTVGLVAVSSYQGWNHMVGGRNSNAQAPGYGTSAFDRLKSAFTIGNPLQSVGYTWNGHTALMTRLNGRVAHVVGFNPKSALWAGTAALFTRQFTTTGEWYDDEPMLDDQTAIAYEVKVTNAQAAELDSLIHSLIGRSDMGSLSEGTVPYTYTFKPGDMKRDNEMCSNCGHAALKILIRYLNKWGKANKAQALAEFLESEKNVAQGKMMQAIGKRFK